MEDIIVDSVCGWVGGAAAVLAFQPLETLLTHLQTSGPEVTVAQHLRHLLTHGGPALWRGTVPLLVLVPLQNALLFVGYGAGERWAKRQANADAVPSSTLFPVFVGGCVGGFAQCFVAAPLELIKVRRQLFQSRLVPFGLLGPLRGLNATLARDVVPHGVWFAAYEGLKTWGLDRLAFEEGGEAKNVIMVRGEDAVALASGAGAATVAWVVGYPTDLLKTRVQASATPLSLTAATRDILKHTTGLASSVAALYRGLGLKLLRAVPSSAVNFFAYEHAKKSLLDFKDHHPTLLTAQYWWGGSSS